ncbi:hypothetical protein TTHERM_00765350 (macronuclear) [Tetrahymena thermophila SB210]|uniref:Uncharacterized protein n=1 Tax=Tetrahymena thermophila (strain SB210) TaxID=312017 RepID=I7LXQ5_TETTS|nr:hypothetical protein TTHERM_00765350 [Tetrahymena thermophila SB210]EAS05149.2 hypothetical protein TTHERM_00765350 [Tetrahymena thermophila SB210]|eukprot:XP_001025394.2 hypothetical protein TTHERM_00765350 [Tetrahymena thermophila SB210]
MKQEDMRQNVSDSKEEPGFQHDTKIQTFKYMPYSQKNKNMPAKIIYQKEPDRLKLQIQEDIIDISNELKGKQKQNFDSPSKIIGQQFFKIQQDELSGNQMKDFRQKQASVGQNPNKLSQNYSTGEFNQSKKISQIVEQQMSNLQNTFTTQIIKKSTNLDFDLSRSLKNNFTHSKDQSTQNYLKRKSVVEIKSSAQQNLDNLVSPSSNKSNQYSFFKAVEPDQTTKQTQVRHSSLDSKPRYQNNIQLPSLVNNNSNSPSATQKGYNIQNQNNSNSFQNSNKSISYRNHRSSFLSYFSNQGETANSTPTNNTNKYSLHIKDNIYQQLEQKQFIQGSVNNYENRASPNNSKFQSIFSQSQQKQDTYNAIFNKYEKSFQQGDEYLSNRRKSNLQSSKVSLSNPTTPQNSKQNFNKQNQNSQFYRMSFQQQYGTPKMTNLEKLEIDSDKFTFDQFQADQKSQNNAQYHFQQLSNSNNINENYLSDNQNIKNDQNSSDHSLHNEKQVQVNQGSTNKQSPSLVNIANLSESTNLTYNQNQGNADNLQLKISNNEFFNEIKSPGQQSQSITLTSISFKDFESIKTQCLKIIKDQLFSEDYHKHSFENAAEIPHNQQTDTIVKFVSLCLEELQQDFFYHQIDHSNPSFVNFKEIETPNQFSFNQLSIQSINHSVNWPKLSFQYPQKFCQTFVERVTSLLEQNDILKKRIQYVKRLVSYNFRKYFCYKDFISEIKGTQNLNNIIEKIIKNIQKFYNNQQIIGYFSDIKSVSYCLLEGDKMGIDKIINKHIIFPNFVNQLSIQHENENDLSTQQENIKIEIQQNQNMSNQLKENTENKQNEKLSSSKLYQLTGIKARKNNHSSTKDKELPGQWKFNPVSFFDIKINIFNTLIEEEFVSSHSIMKILEQIETLRYGTFRCFFGNDIVLSYSEHVKNILNLIPENHLHLILNNSSQGNIKRDFQLFFNQFCEHIFVENSSTQQLKSLCVSQNINLNTETFFLLENQINYIINAMKIIPLCQRKDIKYKLQKLKRSLNLSDIFDNVYDNLIEIVNELQVYSDKQFAQNKQYTDEQIKSIKSNFKYFQYLLHTVLCTEGAFSNYDMGFAFSEHNVKEDSLNFWIKYLKRILQKYNIKNAVISSIEQILIEIIQNKVFI